MLDGNGCANSIRLAFQRFAIKIKCNARTHIVFGVYVNSRLLSMVPMLTVYECVYRFAIHLFIQSICENGYDKLFQSNRRVFDENSCVQQSLMLFTFFPCSLHRIMKPFSHITV